MRHVGVQAYVLRTQISDLARPASRLDEGVGDELNLLVNAFQRIRLNDFLAHPIVRERRRRLGGCILEAELAERVSLSW